MKLIKATKLTGAKRLYRKYQLENQDGFKPTCDFEELEAGVFEFEAKEEVIFLSDIELFKDKQEKELVKNARQNNIFEVEDIIVEQGSKEWLEARAGIISASETPFTVNGTKIPTYDNFVNKKVAQKIRVDLGIIEEEGYKSPIMENGNLLEAGVREEYEKQTGRKIIEKGFVKVKDKMFGASPDGITTDENFNTINIEIKNVTLPRYIAELYNNDVSKEYNTQLQVQMTVLDVDKTHFLVQCQETDKLPLLINEIDRDEVFISNMIETINDFEKDFKERYELISKKIKEK
jgi:hypothetical protein